MDNQVVKRYKQKGRKKYLNSNSCVHESVFQTELARVRERESEEGQATVEVKVKREREKERERKKERKREKRQNCI